MVLLFSNRSFPNLTPYEGRGAKLLSPRRGEGFPKLLPEHTRTPLTPNVE